MASKTRKRMRDKIRERADQRGNSGGGFNTLKLPEGAEFLSIEKENKKDTETTLMLDFIPYIVQADNHPMVKSGEQWFERTYFVHRNIGAEEKPYICPKTFKKPCPICARRKVLMEDWDENKEMIKALRPSERQLFNVIDQADNKVYVLDISFPCFGELLEKEIRGGADEYADFPEAEGGSTIKVRFAEAKIGKTVYWDADRIDFETRGDYGDDIFDYAVDLDDILIEVEAEDLERIFLELDDGDVGPEREEGDPGATDEETSSGPSRPSAPARKAPAKPAAEEAKSDPVKPSPGGGRGRGAKEKAAPDQPSRGVSRERPKRPAAEPEPATAGDESCPHDGKFGDDCDKLDACFECNDWNACKDRQEGVS